MRALRAATLILLVVRAAAPAGAEELAVIVHPQRQASLTTADLARIFLRQRRYWADGQQILPVNRDSGSAMRLAFDRRLFGDDARRLVVYWNQQYFRGVLPPATLASDEAVKRFVASESRAIGYVSASAVDETVRVALRLPDPP
jgi:ABC-type phosphate transport system substrate-binding protein